LGITGVLNQVPSRGGNFELWIWEAPKGKNLKWVDWAKRALIVVEEHRKYYNEINITWVKKNIWREYKLDTHSRASNMSIVRVISLEVLSNEKYITWCRKLSVQIPKIAPNRWWCKRRKEGDARKQQSKARLICAK
jgi:hypothetical protein